MSVRYILPFFLAVFFCFVSSDAQTADELYASSLQKYQEKDAAAYMKLAEKAYRLAPSNPVIMVNLARAYAMNKQKTKCIELMDDISVIGFDFNVEQDSGFKNVWNHSLLKDILAKGKQKAHTVASEILFTLRDTSFVPGGIGYNPRVRKYIIGNQFSGELLIVNPADGTTDKFLSRAAAGLAGIQNLYIDAARNQMWAAGKFTKDGEQSSQMLRLDLDDEERPAFFDLPGNEAITISDFAVAASGDIYLVGRGTNSIYKFNTKDQTISLWYSHSQLIQPSGVAVSPDQRSLFVSTSSGIARISLVDTSMIFLTAPPKVPLNGIDGIYFYQQKIIAMQNNAGPQTRIMKFELNSAMDEVKTAAVLESGNSLYDRLATGTVVGSDLYFIGSSAVNKPSYLFRLSLED